MKTAKPSIIPALRKIKSWDTWLQKVQKELFDLGYVKYPPSLGNESFAFFKTFKEGNKKLYQVAVKFYDYRKFIHIDPSANIVSVEFHCIPLLLDWRMDLIVSKDMELSEFEVMSHEFYLLMSKYK